MKPRIYRTAGMLLALFAIWLLWSGLYKPLLVTLGGLSCAVTYLLARRMGYFERPTVTMTYSFRLLAYWPWLAKQVILSSIDVARIIIHPKLPISPCTLRLEASASDPVDQVILGNSITLTPGTLTLDLHKGVLQVHALSEAGARDLMSGEMDGRVAHLRKE